MPSRVRRAKQDPVGSRDKLLHQLPECAGRKLGQFQHCRLPVHFIRLLSDPEIAAHSHVFEVKIGTERYALKVFRFYDIAEDELGLDDHEIKNPNLVMQLDSFFAECRAFVRINEILKNGKLAIECLEYLHLPADREMELDRKFHTLDWDRPAEEYSLKPSERQPFRAVVKRLVSEPTTWNAKNARHIIRNLKELNASGVYAFDVRARNILGGQLADFSASWTEPHVLFRTRDPDEVRSRKKRDLARFDLHLMMEDLHIHNAPRGLPNRQHMARLRSALS